MEQNDHGKGIDTEKSSPFSVSKIPEVVSKHSFPESVHGQGESGGSEAGGGDGGEGGGNA